MLSKFARERDEGCSGRDHDLRRFGSWGSGDRGRSTFLGSFPGRRRNNRWHWASVLGNGSATEASFGECGPSKWILVVTGVNEH